MPGEFSAGDSSLEPRASPGRTPPGGPPAVAAGVEEPSPSRPRSMWGLLDILPVVLFLLLLAAASMVSMPDEARAKPDVRMVLAVQSIFYAMLLAYIYSIVRLKYRLPFWAGLGWAPVASAGRFLMGGALLAIFVQVLSLPVKSKLPIERLFASREAVWLLAIFGTLVAPLLEELIFRGFLFGALEARWGLRAAVWVNSALFAVIHMPQLRGGIPQILAIFVVGLVLSWVRGRNGSLVPPYFMHLTYNGTMFVMLYVATHGFREFG